MHEKHQPTRVHRGLYAHDLAASEAAGQARRGHAASQVPQFGAGGLSGASMQRNQDLQEAYLRRLQLIEQRRQRVEGARLARNADIAARRRAQAMNLGAQNVRDMVSAGTGLTMRGIRQGMDGDSLGDPYWWMGDDAPEPRQHIELRQGSADPWGVGR